MVPMDGFMRNCTRFIFNYYFGFYFLTFRTIICVCVLVYFVSLLNSLILGGFILFLSFLFNSLDSLIFLDIFYIENYVFPNRNNFCLIFQNVWFLLSFPCLMALAYTSGTTFSRNDEQGHPALFLTPGEQCTAT